MNWSQELTSFFLPEQTPGHVVGIGAMVGHVKGRLGDPSASSALHLPGVPVAFRGPGWDLVSLKRVCRISQPVGIASFEEGLGGLSLLGTSRALPRNSESPFS